MKVSKLGLAALFASLSFGTLIAPTVLKADNIEYAVDQSLPSGSITGTITTDGTLGTLAAANIVGWNLTSMVGASSQVLTPLDSQVSGTGNDLTATPTALTLDFSNLNYGYLSFNAISPDLGYAVWVAGYVSGSYGYVAANVTDNVGLETYQYESGSQGIATVTDTPEPGTSSLMLIGLGFLGMLLLMRKHLSQTSQLAN